MMNWSEYEEEQSQRKTISPYWALAAIIIGVGLALAVAGLSGCATSMLVLPEAKSVASTAVYRDEFTTIRLLDSPCANANAKTMIVGLGENPDQYLAAIVEWK